MPADHPNRAPEARGRMPPKKKKLAAVIKLQINAGAATPAPPVGPALGQHGVNIMEFCKQYNAATEAQRGNVIPVSYTHLRAHETVLDLVCRLLLEKKKKKQKKNMISY